MQRNGAHIIVVMARTPPEPPRSSGRLLRGSPDPCPSGCVSSGATLQQNKRNASSRASGAYLRITDTYLAEREPGPTEIQGVAHEDMIGSLCFTYIYLNRLLSQPRKELPSGEEIFVLCNDPELL